MCAVVPLPALSLWKLVMHCANMPVFEHVAQLLDKGPSWWCRQALLFFLLNFSLIIPLVVIIVPLSFALLLPFIFLFLCLQIVLIRGNLLLLIFPRERWVYWEQYLFWWRDPPVTWLKLVWWILIIPFSKVELLPPEPLRVAVHSGIQGSISALFLPAFWAAEHCSWLVCPPLQDAVCVKGVPAVGHTAYLVKLDLQ